MDLLTLQNIIDDNSERPEDIIGDGILIPKSLFLIAGKQKARKSFLTYNLALAISQGHSFSIFKIKTPKKVLMFSAEGGFYSNRDRIKKMSNSIKIVPDDNLIFAFDARVKLDNEGSCEELKSILKQHKPEILILDPLIKFHNAEENSATEMGIILNKLREIIEDFNLSIILVHHLGKNASKGARGSSAILGEYDSCLTLGKGDSNDYHSLDFDLRHHISPAYTKIRFNPETCWFENQFTELQLFIKNYGSMERKDLVEFCLSEGLYDSDGGAYKKISKEIASNKLAIVDDKIIIPKSL